MQHGLMALGAGLAVGLGAVGTGLAQARIGAAAMAAIAEKPELTGRTADKVIQSRAAEAAQ